MACHCALPLSPADMFLIGTVMFVLGTGLYELFISNMDMSYGSNLFGLFNLPVGPQAPLSSPQLAKHHSRFQFLDISGSVCRDDPSGW
jgi:hypothetical protein